MARPWIAPAWIALALACAGPTARAPGAGPAGSSADGLLAEADRELAEREFAEAERLYREAAARAPEDARPLLGLARLKVATNRIDEAHALADRALALSQTADGLVLRGRVHGLERRFDEAASDLERAVSLDPGNCEGWVLLTAIQVNRGDDVEARRAFGEAARVLGETKAVERVWPTLHGITPDPDQPQEALDRCVRGAVELLRGRPVEAQHEALNGLRYAPRYAWCAATLAEASWRQGDLARAEATLRRVMEAYPPEQEALRADAKGKLAGVLLDAGKDPGEAARLAREALDVRGERAHLLDVLGRACQAAGDAACPGRAH